MKKKKDGGFGLNFEMQHGGRMVIWPRKLKGEVSRNR